MVEKSHTAGWLPNLYEPLRGIGGKIADWFAPRSERRCRRPQIGDAPHNRFPPANGPAHAEPEARRRSTVARSPLAGKAHRRAGVTSSKSNAPRPRRRPKRPSRPSWPPLGSVEQLPVISEADYQTLVARNRERYCTTLEEIERYMEIEPPVPPSVEPVVAEPSPDCRSFHSMASEPKVMFPVL